MSFTALFDLLLVGFALQTIEDAPTSASDGGDQQMRWLPGTAPTAI